MSHQAILYLHCVILVTVVLKGAADMVCEPPPDASSPGSARYRLLSDILCQYDRTCQPQRDVNYTVDLLVRRAKVVDTILEVQALTNLRWIDQYLSWSPDQYDDIQEIQIESEKIWTPPLATVATLPWWRDAESQQGFFPAVCHVIHNGSVTCTSAVELGGACTVSYLFWPHVEASCITFIGSDYRLHKHLHAIFYNDTSVQKELENYVPDNNWVVTECERSGFTTLSTSGTSTALIFKFKLHSRGELILTGLLGPGIVLSILLLGSFSLPANSYARLGLCCCGTFGTVLASSLLFETLPPFEGPVPVIVIFYSSLLILSAKATVMSILLSFLIPCKGKPPIAPRWLYSLQLWLTNSTVGKMCLKLLIMVPQQNICQAFELMPALHMQTDSVPAPANNGREGIEEESSEVDDATNPHNSTTNHISGPHRIWEFMSSFINRCMFCFFLLTCSALCLYLVHSMIVYEDVDFYYFDE